MRGLPHFRYTIGSKEYTFYGKNKADANRNADVWAKKRGMTAKQKKG